MYITGILLIELKNDHFLYTHFEEPFWGMRIFLTKYRDMNWQTPLPAFFASCRVHSQTTCGSGPDGDEPGLVRLKVTP